MTTTAERLLALVDDVRRNDGRISFAQILVNALPLLEKAAAELRSWEWQPIETAKRAPGLNVLGFGKFRGNEGNPSHVIMSWFQPTRTDCGWWTSSALPFEPTHWQPLTSPALTPREGEKL